MRKMMTRRTALALVAGVAGRADEWTPLFDGKSFAGWTLGDGAEVTHSWAVEEGAITTLAGTRGRSDLLYARPFQSFELAFEFRLSQGSNTGLKYFVQQTLRYLYPGSSLAGAYGAIGLEFQLADDTSRDVVHAEQKLGALYGILPVQQAPAYRVGEWANALLICRKGGCEHWINGKRVLAYDPSSRELRRKFQQVAIDSGHSIVGATAAVVAARRRPENMPPALIALQQHDSKAWFRGLRARKLDEPGPA
jgi:hypothetical protein